MRPTLVRCTNGNCDTSISVFTKNESLTVLCPKCKRAVEPADSSSCKSCKCKITKGSSVCAGCAEATDKGQAGA